MSKWEELGGTILSGTISNSIGLSSSPNTTQWVNITMAPRRSGRSRSQQHWSNTPSNAQEEDQQHLSSSSSVKSNINESSLMVTSPSTNLTSFCKVASVKFNSNVYYLIVATGVKWKWLLKWFLQRMIAYLKVLITRKWQQKLKKENKEYLRITFHSWAQCTLFNDQLR